MCSFIHFLGITFFVLTYRVVINRRCFWYSISIRQRSHKSLTLINARHQSINNNTILRCIQNLLKTKIQHIYNRNSHHIDPMFLL